MAIYNVNGSEIYSVYDKQGDLLPLAYDKNGNTVFTQGDVFRVMTYNVGQWYVGDQNPVPTEDKSAYYDLQYGTFENNPVDVLFMQEYTSEWCADGSTASTDFVSPFYDYQEVTSPTGYKGRSIASNYQINDYTIHNFSSYSTSSYMYFNTAKIVVDGKTINLVNTHNDYRISYQRTEVTELLEAVEDMEYFILCGDFNQRIEYGDTSNEHYQNSIQRFLDAGYHVGNGVIDWVKTYQYGAEAGSTTWEYLDQVITSPNIYISRIHAYTAKMTDDIADNVDHIPLIAELVIN